MAGHPSAHRTQLAKVGQLDDISSADSVESEVVDILASPFKVTRIFGQVITGVTTASVTTSLYWRPLPAASTDQVLIATFEIPVAAADTSFWVDLNVNPQAKTTIGAASPTGGYGIAGSASIAGEQEPIVGPGGSLFFTAPDGEAGAGAVELWVEVELLGMGNANSLTTLVRVEADVIGT